MTGLPISLLIPCSLVQQGTGKGSVLADPGWAGENVERCESGRIGRSRKPLSGQLDRGFESHPLRHAQLAGTDAFDQIAADIQYRR